MNDVDHYLLEADGIRVGLDLGIGHIARLEVERAGRVAAPFHRAPWADDPPLSLGEDEAPHLARLSGDFFCAPFGTSDEEPAPAHGWTANAAWQPIGAFAFSGGITARFVLERSVLGAKVVKEFTLRHGHPFLYQRHVFEGGQGALPVASHAMVHLPAGGRMAFSRKRFVETPPTPLEPDPSRGRFLLAYPAQSAELGRFPTTAGGFVDLGRYPIGADHEDFAMLVEADLAGLGWSAVVREQEDDVALMLKDPRRLPVTMLWFSNGGRDYPPWNGRHRNVLGIEDGCTWSLAGHAASLTDNPLRALGIPTAICLDPQGSVDVRHVIGAVPLPEGFTAVSDVRVEEGGLAVTGEDGTHMILPFDPGFLATGAGP